MSGSTPGGLTGHKEWTLRNCRGERISQSLQSAMVHSLQQIIYTKASRHCRNTLFGFFSQLPFTRQRLEIVPKVEDGRPVLNNTEVHVAGPPPHTHTPGLSSGSGGWWVEYSRAGLNRESAWVTLGALGCPLVSSLCITLGCALASG